VRAAVLSADPETKRLKLGMKQLEATPTDQFAQEASVGDRVTGRVIQVLGSRVTVQLGEGVEGVCTVENAGGGSTPVVGGSLAAQLRGSLERKRIVVTIRAISEPYSLKGNCARSRSSRSTRQIRRLNCHQPEFSVARSMTRRKNRKI
jgi:hypothetical protein